tara:strand:+ start:2427 stop:2705 length:279 start_codon:yes stop_codon:yes gene_type:complete
MKIKTNHHLRPVLYWHDLEASEQSELADSYDDIEESSFFRYRGQVYDLGEFMLKQDPLLSAWDGVFGKSYFSAVLVKYSDDYEAVKVGLALS